MKQLFNRLHHAILYSWVIILTIASQCNPQTSSSKQEAVYTGRVHSSLANYNLIEKDGKINPHLLDFLNLFGIKHQGTVQSVNEAMQQHFIRKPGQERWHLSDTQEDQEKREMALSLLNKMGFVHAIYPFQAHTDYYLLFIIWCNLTTYGATL